VPKAVHRGALAWLRSPGTITAQALSGPRKDPLRLFAALSTELFPRRLHTTYADPALPPLSPWGAGLAVGLLWGAP
jgi:hypothetical protein